MLKDFICRKLSQTQEWTLNALVKSKYFPVTNIFRNARFWYFFEEIFLPKNRDTSIGNIFIKQQKTCKIHLSGCHLQKEVIYYR